MSLTDGLFVEEVRRESLKLDSPIQVGDVLLSWRTLKRPSDRHPSEEGIFHHPFDFLDFLNEQAARSPLN